MIEQQYNRNISNVKGKLPTPVPDSARKLAFWPLSRIAHSGACNARNGASSATNLAPIEHSPRHQKYF